MAAVLLAIAAPEYAAASSTSDQDTPPASVSHPVVEPTAPSAGKALNTALGQLAKDPRNVDTLLAAGNAAIALGDNAAALGFFSRADQLAPTSAPASVGKVKAAIAGAHLHLDDPVEALRWYADAEQAGADPATFAADRGLAYDLVGDNAAAVAQYRVVLDHSADATLRDEVTRRLALSLAIGGDRGGAERALLPLLQRQDRAAWRTHTFVLAVAGRSDDAVSVAHATMPPNLADAIAPYLRFMVRLTPSQQAAVASLGTFPRAADIGRDDPRVMAYSAAHPHVRPAPVATASPALARAADTAPIDPKTARARRRRGAGAAPVAVASAAPVQAEADIVLPPPPPPPTAAMASVSGPPVAPIASRTPSPARGSFDLAQVSGSAQVSGGAEASGSAGQAVTGTAPAPTVPRPVVLSRLDMPPAPRRTALQAPRLQPAAVPAALPQAQAIPSAPSSATPDPAMTSHPVVEAIPAAPETPVVAKPVPPPVIKDTPKPEIVKADKTAKGRAAKTRETADGVHEPQTGKAKPSDAKPSEKSTEKGAHGKTAHGKAAKADAEMADLPPCKPAAPTKGRKGKAARADARANQAAAAKARSHHGRKGKPEPKDSETCAPLARGDRPDGPGGVSRDADTEDTAKARIKGKGKGKAGDSDKPAEKGGRHARYASRIWVEVLTGADRDKMPGEWRNLLRKSRALKKHKPYLTPWRSNFRLLTGPFDSDADAQDFIAELRKEGVPGFEWTSPAGQAVDSLPVP